MAKRTLQNILVTGGSGFIGSNFIRYLFGMSASGSDAFADAAFSGRVVNLDCLTYAGNNENLTEVQENYG
ncbi:MAG: dTDP-glucose 4,6-dehydratase, partial [Treponema sp.]|nr:dTDP-glucose 4,6-dehydratase [Treponema sp.]